MILDEGMVSDLLSGERKCRALKLAKGGYIFFNKRVLLIVANVYLRKNIYFIMIFPPF